MLRDVARVAGIRWGATAMLPPAELLARLTAIQSAAQRYLRQIPEARLDDMLPNRPRSYGQLVYHIFNIADAFLEHETEGLPLLEGAYSRVQAPGTSKAQLGRLRPGRAGAVRRLVGRGRPVHRLRGQGQRLLRRRQPARVPGAHHLAFGPARAPAHDGAGQARPPAGRACRRRATFAGLPMPDKVWDDEKPAARAQSIPGTAGSCRAAQPRWRGASAISLISLEISDWPNASKLSASTTNAPGPPITLFS